MAAIYLTLNLQSADNIALSNYKNKILNLLFNFIHNYNCKIITLPIKIKHYSILRSPHVYKKSIEAYEERIYSINIKIKITNYKTYINLFYIIKFIKNNTPLTINFTLKLRNNV